MFLFSFIDKGIYISITILSLNIEDRVVIDGVFVSFFVFVSLRI